MFERVCVCVFERVCVSVFSQVDVLPLLSACVSSCYVFSLTPTATVLRCKCTCMWECVLARVCVCVYVYACVCVCFFDVPIFVLLHLFFIRGDVEAVLSSIFSCLDVKL